MGCLKCPKNSFSNFTGQAICKPCGNSALSSNDSLTCNCKGQNRVFHQSDGSCRCRLGFTVYSNAEGDAALADADGILSCDPITYPNCNGVRGESGACVNSGDSATYCKAACPPGTTATYAPMLMSETIGEVALCSCKCASGSSGNVTATTNSTVSISCDDGKSPPKKTFKLTTDKNGNTFTVVTNTVTGASTLYPISSAPGMFGSPKCSGDCNIQVHLHTVLFCTECSLFIPPPSLTHQIMSTSSSGFTGVTDAGSSSISKILGKSNAAATRAYNERMGHKVKSAASRELHQVTSPTDTTGIVSPMVCIKVNEGMMFQVSYPSH